MAECVITLPNQQLYCTLCCVQLSGVSEKALKQHLKSQPHKQKLKDPNAGQRHAPKACAPVKGEEAVQEEEETACSWCDALQAPEPTERPLHSSNPPFCHPPPLSMNPRKDVLLSSPFVTFRSHGTHAVLAEDLPAALGAYCNHSPNYRLPNVDINGENSEVKSWSQAARLLSQADNAKLPYWASFMADIEDPDWWPRKHPVPTYSNVIVGSGRSGIGIHIDVDNYNCTRVPVDTYLTLVCGAKYVIMLPPDQHMFEKDQPFPDIIDAELARAVVDAGGYYFVMAPSASDDFPSLYIPKGWQHWLIGAAPWHVVLGSSKYQ